MQTKVILAAVIALPLLLACDPAEQSPTAANPSQEKQSMTPDSPERTLERSPSAAGTPSPADFSSNPAAPSIPSLPREDIPPGSPSGSTPGDSRE